MPSLCCQAGGSDGSSQANASTGVHPESAIRLEKFNSITSKVFYNQWRKVAILTVKNLTSILKDFKSTF
jgi:hypothetical protein